MHAVCEACDTVECISIDMTLVMYSYNMFFQATGRATAICARHRHHGNEEKFIRTETPWSASAARLTPGRSAG